MCAKSTSLKEYLKRYESNTNPEHLDCCAEEDIDLSPPRQRRKRYDTPSPEPDENLTQSDMHYLRISKEELILNARSWKKNKMEEKAKEIIKLEWGNGLAQKREAEAELMELELEKDRPFSRSRNDVDLDSITRERLRWGDPMAHNLVKKSRQSELMALQDLGDSQKMKESGFIQDIPLHSWLKTGFDAAPPNRYSIKPGRHWDGVDRSNGFENQMFERMNQIRATEKEAYLWSVSDM